MKYKMCAVLVLSAAIYFVARSLADDMSTMPLPASSPPATQPTTQPFSAIDVRNTICPVSGDTVLTSNLVEVYDGKVYHLCCADCYTDFEKNPEKYAKLVADNPAKYGVK
jgi:YHS domain-containing protein